MDFFARERRIHLSSRGCLKASRVVLLNSGISSKKSTPRWLSVISPGQISTPPPIMIYDLNCGGEHEKA